MIKFLGPKALVHRKPKVGQWLVWTAFEDMCVHNCRCMGGLQIIAAPRPPLGEVSLFWFFMVTHPAILS